MKKIAILGTGGVGNTIGTKLIELGYEVMMGSRSSNNEKAKAFAEKFPGKAKSGTFNEAINFSDLIFNCTKGENSVDALKLAGETLSGKTIVDFANPLDFSNGMPPCLFPHLSNTWSLGEELQKQFPEANIIKTLNTMWAGLMVDPNMIGDGDHVNYICGNNSVAKETVIDLLMEFGWKRESIIDLGDITNARATEAVLPIWLRVWGVTKTGAFNFKIVK